MQATRHAERLERVHETLEAVRADWLIVPPSADFRWLTGARARATERLVMLALPQRGDPFCLVPRLESDALGLECPWLELEIWEEHEDPFARLARRLTLERRPSVLVGDGLRAAPMLRLTEAARCRAASEVLAPLRAVKDREELQLMEQAAGHADQVVERVADHLPVGLTERQAARFAIEQLEALGDTDPWVIIATGPNSALPHHHTSDRRILEDDVALIDLGASTQGYGSDITRTYWLGTPPDGAPAVYQVVNEARRAGIEASSANVPAEKVDRAARQVITRAGLGDHFLHRTGHGVGLEVHELPYLVSGNRAPLEAGMVHSVEPGVYFQGRYGVRLEDLVVVEENAARPLNRAPFDPRPPRRRG